MAVWFFLTESQLPRLSLMQLMPRKKPSSHQQSKTQNLDKNSICAFWSIKHNFIIFCPLIMFKFNRKFLLKEIFQIVLKFIDSCHMFISIFQDVCNIFRAKQYPSLLDKFSLPIYLLFCFLVGLNKCQVWGHQRQHPSSPTKSPSECLYHYTCIY